MAITDPTVALAVINEAKAAKVHNSEIPESNDARLALANQLHQLAIQAIGNGVTAEAVHRVVNAGNQQAPAAAPAPAGGNPFDPTPAAPVAASPAPAAANPFPAAPAAAPVAPAVPEAPQVIAPPASAADPKGINDIIPNYDNLPIGELGPYLAGLDDRLLGIVKQYEASQGGRAVIAEYERPAAPVAAPAAPAAPASPFDTPAAAPAAAPVAAAPEAPAGAPQVNVGTPSEQYGTVEPWIGYSKAKIKDIMAFVTQTFADDAVAAKPLLAHVWKFETDNQGRSTLIKKLTELAQNGIVNPAAPAPAAAAAAPEPADVKTESPFGGVPATPAPAAPVPTAPPAVDPNLFGEGIAAPLNGSTQKAQAFVGSEFPAPAAVTNVPEIPADFTVLTTEQVRQYQSVYSAAQARATYLLAIADGHVADAKIAADAAVDAFIRENGDPKATVKALEAQASAGTEVATFRHTQHEWAEVARQYRAFVDIYNTTCQRLSREQTGRADEANTVRG